jgi:hypothetical protein
MSIESTSGSFGQPTWSASGTHCWQGRLGSRATGAIVVVVVVAGIVVGGAVVLGG